ncbi:MAG: hypothetical protein EOP04_07085 [Proteobacteria bacterium]|nr:MAG: hypothetical protein EOP04_07085 [Pseudomonadota bacterium]
MHTDYTKCWGMLKALMLKNLQNSTQQGAHIRSDIKAIEALEQRFGTDCSACWKFYRKLLEENLKAKPSIVRTDLSRSHLRTMLELEHLLSVENLEEHRRLVREFYEVVTPAFNQVRFEISRYLNEVLTVTPNSTVRGFIVGVSDFVNQIGTLDPSLGLSMGVDFITFELLVQDSRHLNEFEELIRKSFVSRSLDLPNENKPDERVVYVEIPDVCKTEEWKKFPNTPDIFSFFIKPRRLMLVG